MNTFPCINKNPREEDVPLWVATLSDGRTVFENGPDDWKLLKRYCEQHYLKVVGLHIRFRSNGVYPLPDNADGYYFARGVLAILDGSPTQHRYVIGYLDKDVVRKWVYNVPELLMSEWELKHVSEVETDWLIAPNNGYVENYRKNC